VSMSATDLQAARESVIAAFRPLAKDEVVLGQFDGYRTTEGIAKDSTRDTFVAAKLWIDTDRWRDVPFLLRTGKMLAQSEQQVSLIFRDPEGPLRRQAPAIGNVLTVKVSGAGAINLRMVIKQPGPEFTLTTSTTDLKLECVDGGDPLPPYVRLIHDVIIGDRTLFTRPDGLGYAWDAITPLLEDRPEVQSYATGSWGPAAASALAAPDCWLLGQTD
jgi:glucose-6-phosphate 1-dehydrogenase